jgi:TonB family protein
MQRMGMPLVLVMILSVNGAAQENPAKHDSDAEKVSVAILPHSSVNVPPGGSQVLTATVKGSPNTRVKWTVDGAGCSGDACGVMSGDLYLAPHIAPHPATVTLTAISEADPNARDSITIGIGQVFKVGGGVSAPRVIFQLEPEYTKEARQAKYSGTCVLQLVVGVDGLPRDITVTRSIGLGLDEKAVEAVRRWRFEPAMKDGKPVAVLISIQMAFHP